MPSQSASTLPKPDASRVLTAKVDFAMLRPRFGVFANGYTDDDVNEVFGAICAATGLEFAVVWNCHDSWGFGGDSDFAVRVDGRLHAFTQVDGADIRDFLCGDGPCPESLGIAVDEPLNVEFEHGFNASWLRE